MVNLQKNPQQHKNIAFVLGNGVSRLSANLSSLKEHGVVYGCNALYREYTPDHLIAVDVKMVNEIIDTGYQNTNSVWTNNNKGVKSFDNINVLNPHKGWSSGPTALWLAATHGYKEIYILGFDYEGLKGFVNNVYSGTPNYKGQYEAATFFGNWSSQTEKVIKEYAGVKFYRVLSPTRFTPPTWKNDMPNLVHISYSDLESKFLGITNIPKNDQKPVI